MILGGVHDFVSCSYENLYEFELQVRAGVDVGEGAHLRARPEDRPRSASLHLLVLVQALIATPKLTNRQSVRISSKITQKSFVSSIKA